MKKIALILNHVQAGMGSDENAMLPPSGKKSALGPGEILKPMFQSLDVDLVATLFCGDQYYLSHAEEVEKKFIGFAQKFEIDAVLCGPAMQYPNFGEMAARLAKAFEASGISSVASMAIENPATELFKNEITIVKMPSKGGIGLQDSFKNMALVTSRKAHKEDITNYSELLF
ncbi:MULTISPECIES: GrdB-related putative oxidoreductase [Vagococcus]|uniref:Uncharacterized protein n=1 Tax=Vagococcus fluvialis bH819 TaxID=1255619 RepID=A0A1X6WJS4_9ENTE|nr:MULTISPECIES: GrdB-related putative oxidoreductase [Vagococcus]SLM84505.1 hypothetical protein FM121_00330 [Vagococcus fluvialis bH819]HCM90543.1 glycine/betaine/sarcosine/D-proline reductase family selenoprotein B [Vagococcus sp.]